jgi:hypothetical protein
MLPSEEFPPLQESISSPNQATSPAEEHAHPAPEAILREIADSLDALAHQPQPDQNNERRFQC